MCSGTSLRQNDAEKTDLLQGTLDLLILQVTALGPAHGYAISQRLQSDLARSVASATGFTVPGTPPAGEARLAARRVAKTETAREAKFYVVTATGRKRLDVERTEWCHLTEAIALVLQTAK